MLPASVIARGMYEEMRAHFGFSLQNGETSVTLEFREFDPETYQQMV